MRDERSHATPETVHSDRPPRSKHDVTVGEVDTVADLTRETEHPSIRPPDSADHSPPGAHIECPSASSNQQIVRIQPNDLATVRVQP